MTGNFLMYKLQYNFYKYLKYKFINNELLLKQIKHYTIKAK